ncbi:MAG: FAD-dependent oxidoreductase [Clostridiales Family XIII bacterium]|jgi:flavorubredoxin/NADPH-dependent 2,4-dienoyl-CoA reductase/sulfur reductase-like enzyme|nr:FAD-dependent oxidoreductase [Clostridiales Family XIII bacterium]
MSSRQIAKDFYWVGSLDPDLRVFDIIMETEFGTTYNSYVLVGSEKTALFESSKLKCLDSYIKTLSEATPPERIDYIVVSHTEPDHTGAIAKLLDLNPRMKLVGSAAAINFMKEICNRDFNSTVVKNGDELSLGDKTLRFLSVPNLHWPDSIFTYVPEIETLVTCDMFGCHYSSEGVTNDAIEDEDGYRRALRYYFDNIMGPFKSDVLHAIDMIDGLPIKTIAVGHGPVLVKEPLRIVETYREWASPAGPNPAKTVVIPYVSAYGYTGKLAERIAEGIREGAKANHGDIDVKLFDLVVSDKAVVLDEMARADGMLFGTPTVVGDALKPIWDLATSMFAKTHGGKFASAFGSYGWSGEGVPNIMARLSQLRLRLYGEGLRCRFNPGDAELQEAFEFGYGFGLSVLAGKIVEPRSSGGSRRVWKCLICGELVEGDEPPMSCPVCGVGPQQFVEAEPAGTGFSLDSDERFIVIGNGAAGTAACEEIRKRNRTCSIEMFSREDLPAYNRPMLTKGILSDIDGLNLFVKPEGWYSENSIKLTLGANVAAIDTVKKQIRLESGEIRPYDKLIIATGAEAFRPPISGADAEGVFAIRTLADVKAMQSFMRDVRAAVVIGGGVLGLEAAWEMKKAGKDVSVVEAAPRLMARQLDERAAGILRDAAVKAGLKVFTAIGVAGIEADGGRVSGVRLADGSVLPAELALLSTGVRQNADLAAAAGIECDRSIKVNARMETGAESVYACGDCASFEGRNYGIWPQALEMGRVAGANAAGEELAYGHIVPSNAFNGLGISLFAIGDNGSDPEKRYKTLEIDDAAKHTYEKLYFVNNRFAGGALLGDVSKSVRLLEAYDAGDPLEKLL